MQWVETDVYDADNIFADDTIVHDRFHNKWYYIEAGEDPRSEYTPLPEKLAKNIISRNVLSPIYQNKCCEYYTNRKFCKHRIDKLTMFPQQLSLYRYKYCPECGEKLKGEASNVR